jgi:putative endonuclease
MQKCTVAKIKVPAQFCKIFYIKNSIRERIHMKKNETGKLGEMAAADFLRKNGYTIQCANFRTRFGEIDIIATDENFIVFAEVKTRVKDSMVLPREAVDFFKQKKIIKAAQQYLSQNAVNLQPRFDVIEITTQKNSEFKILSINLIENAFTL